jgi:rRNA maturation endonuclease Nob1
MENNSYDYRMQADNEELEEEFPEEEEEEAAEEYVMSFACEDCDYRWEMSFESEEESEEVQFCPMCGSANTTQI